MPLLETSTILTAWDHEWNAIAQTTAGENFILDNDATEASLTVPADDTFGRAVLTEAQEHTFTFIMADIPGRPRFGGFVETVKVVKDKRSSITVTIPEWDHRLAVLAAAREAVNV